MKKKPRRLALALMVVVTSAAGLLSASALPAEADPGQKPGTWETLAPVPTRFAFSIGVEGASVGVVGNTIISAVGHDAGDTNLTRLYDIASDTWSMGAPAPGTSSEGAAAAHGGLFYVVGGRGAGLNALWAYDPAADAWTTLASLPTGRNGLAAAVVGNAIYAIGGRTGGSPNAGGVLSVVERYDIDTGTWSTVASLPSARSDVAAAAVGGKIYVFGGFGVSGSALTDVDVYDPVTDAWSTAPADMPTARGSFYAVASRGNTVYAIGGWSGGAFPGATGSLVEAYQVSSDSWTVGLPPMPTPRAEAGAVGHGGKIYVVGGAQPGFGASVDAHEVYKP